MSEKGIPVGSFVWGYAVEVVGCGGCGSLRVRVCCMADADILSIGLM